MKSKTLFIALSAILVIGILIFAFVGGPAAPKDDDSAIVEEGEVEELDEEIGFEEEVAESPLPGLPIGLDGLQQRWNSLRKDRVIDEFTSTGDRLSEGSEYFVAALGDGHWLGVFVNIYDEIAYAAVFSSEDFLATNGSDVWDDWLTLMAAVSDDFADIDAAEAVLSANGWSREDLVNFESADDFIGRYGYFDLDTSNGISLRFAVEEQLPQAQGLTDGAINLRFEVFPLNHPPTTGDLDDEGVEALEDAEESLGGDEGEDVDEGGIENAVEVDEGSTDHDKEALP